MNTSYYAIKDEHDRFLLNPLSPWACRVPFAQEFPYFVLEERPGNDFLNALARLSGLQPTVVKVSFPLGYDAEVERQWHAGKGRFTVYTA